MSPPAFFFDLDGTLLDTAPTLSKAANHAAQMLGYPEKDNDFLRSFVSDGARATLEQLIPEEHIEKARDIMLNHYLAHISEGTAFFQPLEQTLRHLQDAGLLWGILTNKPRYLSTHLLTEVLPWWSQQTLYCADDFARSKPYPDPLQHIATTHQLNLETAYYIGDHRKDIQSACAAHWQSIAVTYGYFEANDSPTLWGADYVITSPKALHQWIIEQC